MEDHPKGGESVLQAGRREKCHEEPPDLAEGPRQVDGEKHGTGEGDNGRDDGGAGRYALTGAARVERWARRLLPQQFHRSAWMKPVSADPYCPAAGAQSRHAVPPFR
jgi:hypothetical protein